MPSPAKTNEELGLNLVYQELSFYKEFVNY